MADRSRRIAVDEYAGMHRLPVNDPGPYCAKCKVNQFCIARIARFA